ncbi:hypothetical protein [Marinilactibacillus sp. Marseille-P9653]|uniref:hypothetical protein n=1 Tax=Marinilactibacillus sp. Marseille-P9653 TaxID=2866583 RepID=UPI001CE46F22|nr:hypothetical protein [Marinilactibacillus sp. Marseille-P9653]
MNSVGGTGYYEHEVFVIEKIDQELVQIGIPKNSSMDHFELTTENLGKVYTDGIRRILEHTEVTN